jgi:hypothetical protein
MATQIHLRRFVVGFGVHTATIGYRINVRNWAFAALCFTAQRLPVGFEERSARRQRLNVATWW